MFKKALSLLLSLMLIVTSLSVTIFSVSAADGSTYVVAGMSALCDSEWDPTDTNNEMTLKDDGTYEIVFAEVAAQNSLQFKVVENTADGLQNWYGVDGGDNNITFHVIDTCDVTITFDPETKTSTVSGDNVEIPTDLSIDKMVAVGNGDGTWLNGLGWDVADADGLNTMEEVEPGVYEITYEEIEEFDNYQVKFAANGSWADNWGGVYTASGVETDAVYNSSDNITVDVPYEMANVTLRLDLTGFDYATKTGAKFTVTVTDTSGNDPVVETTVAEEETTVVVEEETTVAEEETTAAPATGALNVTGTSNFFPEAKASFNEETNQVTVTYFWQCEKNLLNTQWELTYDPEVLEFNLASNYKFDEYGDPVGYNIMPVAADAILNYPEEGRDDALEPGTIKGNCTKLGLYKLNRRNGFVSVTFDVIGTGNTTVDLFVDVLTVSLVDSTFQSDDAEEQNLVNHGVLNQENIDSLEMTKETCTYAGTYNPSYVPEETTVAPETTTEEATTVVETTTEEVTTEEPTTEEVTTEEVVVGESTYTVAGSSTAIFGTAWDASVAANAMTKSGDVFTITYPAVAPEDAVQLKVVEQPADGSEAIWHGDATGNNITFNVVDTCDVTVTIDPVTKEITVSGDSVELVQELIVEEIHTVGNGDGNWLNGISWDPADPDDLNLMTEITDKVYQIKYEDIEEFDNYQVKFAANGSWADNWGGVYEGSGVVSEAVYNANDNITVDVPYAMADVTITLDLTNFNYATKTGATFTVVVEDAEEEETTVVETTTEEVTTEEVTTEEVTTEEPTTEEVTTEEVVVGESTYTVAGSSTAIFGTAWDASVAANAMTKSGDVFTITYPAVEPEQAVQLKVVEQPADGSEAIWHGDATGNNITFNVVDTCDVTVTIDPVTKEITVSGDNVELVLDLEVEAMRTVGNGDGAWLNGVSWDPADDVNAMTEITDNVYQIKYEDIEEFDNYQFKFAANGSWADNWGGVYTASGVETDAVYNGDNIVIDVPYAMADVTITLDLTNFNYGTKTGATFTVVVEDKSEEEETTVEPTTEEVTTEEVTTEEVTTEAPTTVEPTTEEVTTEAPTTEAPTTVNNTLKVTATSNYFPAEDATVVYSDGKTVTVTYYLQSEKDLLNGQWKLAYDPALLAPAGNQGNYMPNINSGDMAVENEQGIIEGSFSSLNLYDFSTSKAFVQITFTVLGTGETVVDLNVTDLVVSEPTASGTSDETKEEILVQNSDVIEGATETVRDTVISEEVPEVPTTTEEVTTEAPTTVEPTTVEPTTVEPTTVEPTTVEPTTVEPTTVEPTTVPDVTIPEDTTAPTTVEPTTVPDVTIPEETTEAPTTEAPTTEAPTTPVEPGTTTPDATSATDATGVTTGGSSSSDTPAGGSSNSGAVQTGNASMALVILLVLVSASAALYFARKRVK